MQKFLHQGAIYIVHITMPSPLAFPLLLPSRPSHLDLNLTYLFPRKGKRCDCSSFLKFKGLLGERKEGERVTERRRRASEPTELHVTFHNQQTRHIFTHPSTHKILYFASSADAWWWCNSSRICTRVV